MSAWTRGEREYPLITETLYQRNNEKMYEYAKHDGSLHWRFDDLHKMDVEYYCCQLLGYIDFNHSTLSWPPQIRQARVVGAGSQEAVSGYLQI